jgi:hypothetical protein
VFLNNNFTLADGWHPPARWVGKAPAAENTQIIQTSR